MITILPADDAPIPLRRDQAIERAARLAGHVSWSTVAFIMGEYHGHFYTGRWWKVLVDEAGIDVQYSSPHRAKMAQIGPRNLGLAA